MRTVAFDLDDTLYREHDYVASGNRAVAQALADDTGFDPELLYQTIWRGYPRGFEAALALTGNAATLTVDRLVDIYRSHRPCISLRPGARAMLERLRSSGAVLMLITDGDSRRQRAKIEALGIEEFFDPADIIISGETGGDKHTDIPWDIAMARHGLPGMRFTYIGDNIDKDFRQPRRRGWQTVMLLDRSGDTVFSQRFGGRQPDKLPAVVIDDLSLIS